MDWYYVFLKLSEQHTSAYFPPSHNAIMWKYSTLKVTNHISLYRHELQCVSIEQNRDVLTSSGCTAHTQQSFGFDGADTIFPWSHLLPLLPPVVAREKEWENLPHFWVCWSVSLCPWTAAHSCDICTAMPKRSKSHVAKVLAATQASPKPTNLSALQDISHNTRRRTKRDLTACIPFAGSFLLLRLLTHHLKIFKYKR